MIVRQLFYADSGALRALWRLMIFTVVSIVALIVVEALAGPVINMVFGSFGISGVADESWVWCGALLLSTTICLRWVDKRPWRDVWLGRDAARPRALSIGFIVGAFAIALPTALLIVAGWLRNSGGAPGSWWGAMVRVTLTLLPAALLEELMTRGYVLSVLRESWGWIAAVAVTSLGFGLLHLSNPGSNASSVALVTLAGFFLAAILYVTRSLYAAWMAHFAWNWTMAVVFHTAVSGIAVERPNYGYVDAGPDWATGGDWGPEGGVPAAFGMIAGMAFLFARRRPDPATSVRTTNETEES